MIHKFLASTFATVLFAVCASTIDCQQAQRSASNQEKISALKDMLPSGLLPQQQYDAKVRALKASAEEPDSGAPVATKTAGIFDPTLGGILFTSYVIPADWVFQGAMTQGTGCNVASYAFFRASSPDGLTGVKIFPPTEYLHEVRDQTAECRIRQGYDQPGNARKRTEKRHAARSLSSRKMEDVISGFRQQSGHIQYQ
jgi:hypothetical protein